jgi:hypothetical protein
MLASYAILSLCRESGDARFHRSNHHRKRDVRGHANPEVLPGPDSYGRAIDRLEVSVSETAVYGTPPLPDTFAGLLRVHNPCP